MRVEAETMWKILLALKSFTLQGLESSATVGQKVEKKMFQRNLQ